VSGSKACASVKGLSRKLPHRIDEARHVGAAQRLAVARADHAAVVAIANVDRLGRGGELNQRRIGVAAGAAA